LKNGDYLKKALLQEFYFRTKKNLTLTLRGWYQKNDRNLPPLMSYEGPPRTEFQKDDQLRVQFGIKKYSDRINYQYISGLSYSTMKYFLQSDADHYIIRDAESFEKNYFNQLKVSLHHRKIVLAGSLEASYCQVGSDEKVNGEGYDKTRLESGLLVSLQYKPTTKTGLFVLSRSEMNDSKVVPFIPSVGGDWQIAKNFPLLLKMNVTRNFHHPALNDLYWNPGGNPGLLPEKASDLRFTQLAGTLVQGNTSWNGMLGALIWEKDDKLRSSFDRAELWDLCPMENFDKPEWKYGCGEKGEKSGFYPICQSSIRYE